jgi:prefoldin subunit 5
MMVVCLGILKVASFLFFSIAMSEYWEDKLKEQKEHYEGFISTLHEIIRQKKERIEELETLVEQKQQRETPPFLKSDIDALKLMLQQQLRINQSLRAGRIGQAQMQDATAQTDSRDSYMQQRYSRIDHSLTSLSICMKDIMNSLLIPEEIAIDTKTKRLEFITISIKKLQSFATTLEVECKALLKKKENLLRKLGLLESIVQETSKATSRKIKTLDY